MQDAAPIRGIESRYGALVSLMDERMRRQWAAAEARSYGWGGLPAVSRATGMSPTAIAVGRKELETREADPQAARELRLRKPGGGRKRLTAVDPELAASLERLVDPMSVGMDHDTAQFAAEAIHRWWKKMGSKRHRGAKRLLITTDGGGSNGSRCRLWKVALQGLAGRLGMPIQVCHFPPGASKWNKIEHRMFCHITQNWRGRPLVSHDVIISLIANTVTAKGLRIRAELDRRAYPLGIKVTDEELAAVKIKPAAFHGD